MARTLGASAILGLTSAFVAARNARTLRQLRKGKAAKRASPVHDLTFDF